MVGEKVRRTWVETLTRWLKEHEHKKSFANDLRSAAFWTKGFEKNGVYFMDQITPDVVYLLRNAEVGRRHARDVNVVRLVSKNTYNRKLAFLRSVVNAAHAEYLWLEARPLFRGYKENNNVVRWLRPHEFDSLYKALPSPYNSMALLAVSTGMRLGNVSGLKWEYVDLARKTLTYPGSMMKNGKPFSVALNSMAVQAIRNQLGVHEEWLYLNSKGERVKSVHSKMWKKALLEAKIENFRWHDLRHTWATWLRRKKVPLDVIQEMGGWQSAAMVQRYAHLDVDHLAESAAVLDGVLTPAHSAFSQKSHNGGLSERVLTG